MPHAVAAGIASTALAPAVVGGGLTTALGTGLALGSGLAASGGITGLMGGLGGAGAVAPGAFGALAPAAMAKLAPAAASQLAGTIGAGVAPGAFGANLAGAAAPGLTGAVGGGVAPGAFGANLASALPNAATPTIEQMAAKYLAQSKAAGIPIANANNLNFLNSATAGLQGSGGPLQMYSGMNSPAFLNTTLQGSALPGVTSNLPAASLGNTVGGPAIPNVTSQLATAPATSQIIPPTSSIQTGQNFLQNLGNFFQNPSMQGVKDYASEHPYATAGIAGLGAMGLKKLFEQKGVKEPESNAMIRPYTYDRSQRPEAYAVSPTEDSSERLYFNDQFNAGEPYKVAGGGIVSLAVGGPVEQMAAMNAVGANTGYPMANLQTPMYSNPAMQRPEATNVIAPSADAGVGAYSGEARFAGGGETQYGVSSNPNYVNPENQARAELAGGRRPIAPTAPLPKYSYDPKTMQFTQTVGGNKVSGGINTPAMNPIQPQRPTTSINIPAYQSPEQQLGLGGFYDYMNQQLGGYGGYAGYARGGNVGGEFHLGDYSDGGRLLKGPGDGVSDSIPASIGGRQPARLADGEFVVPARIVSELGNGSTEAGARKLYAMMDRVQKGRRKSVGKGKVAVNSKADKYLPA